MTYAAVFVIVFIAVVVQTVAGFGGALVAMPLLTLVLGLPVAAPALALTGLVSTTLNAVRWRAHITFRDVVALTIPALIAIPIGVLAIGRINPEWVTNTLGVVIILYAIYALVGRPLPELAHGLWPVVAGFTSGLLAGAFNTGGPPVVAYADARRWRPEKFRGNLQAFFLASAVVVAVSHIVDGNVTLDILKLSLFGIIPLLIAQRVGVWLCRYINPVIFRRIVLVLLLLLGLQLIIL